MTKYCTLEGMTMKSAIEHWLELAEYDWKSAQVMFRSKRYLYVGFLCHQVAEKLYKALYTKLHEKIPPYTHDLIKLASLTVVPPEEVKLWLSVLNPLYIKCRYPAYKVKIANILNGKASSEILHGTKELKEWLKFQLT